MIVYQVKSWDKLFENFKSRTVDSCRYVCIPNKQHGMGLRWLLSQKDGFAVYGLFNLIAGACSQQCKPRDGWLTDDGSATGRPWTPSDMAVRWATSEAFVSYSMKLLSDTKTPCGWIAVSEVTEDINGHTNTAVSAQYPPGIRPVCTLRNGIELNGIEEKGREEGVAADATTASTSLPPILEFQCLGKPESWGLTAEHLAELREQWPNVRVEDCLRELAQRQRREKGLRKTSRGMSRFLQNWLGMEVKSIRKFTIDSIAAPPRNETEKQRKDREINEMIDREFASKP